MHNTDVCIVGAGVAGITLARKISSSGVRVTLVESGSTRDTPLAHDLSRGEHVGTPYWSLDYTRTRRFGGCADMWFLELMDGRKGLRLRPLDPVDFEVRRDIPNSGWPVSYRDVQPYYLEAEDLFEVRDGEDWNPASDDTVFADNTSELRTVNFRLSPGNLFSEKYYREITSTNVQLFLESTVLKLKLNDSGSRVDSLLVRRAEGDLFEIRAHKVVLACGGIENPRLMLLSSELGGKPLGTSTENVGRYFMEHPHFLSGTIVPTNTRWLESGSRYRMHSYDGATQISKVAPSPDLVREHGLLNFCMHLSPASNMSGHELQRTRVYDAVRVLRSYAVGRTMPVELSRYLVEIASGIPDLLSELKRRISSPKASNSTPGHFDLYHMSEQIPNPASRVVLGKSRDAFDQPRPRLEWRLTDDDLARVLKGQQLIQAGLSRSGAGLLRPVQYDKLPPPGIRGGYHHMGTTRMSSGPESGVVDKNCKVHGMENLFVAGSSVFPTSGYANPTFTIGALSLRLANHLLE
ncbi:MAG: GMC family oxidoreductase [Rhodothermales bacterium]|nr:GMC family oxidoreductase [Rhodothermales bacterium]